MDKKSLFSLQNFVKEEPVSNGTARLQTFRAPRDLSLGGTKPKKLYVPNLNVTRSKNKPKDITRKDTKRNLRRDETKHSNRSNLNSKYIQTQGVFSEGSGDIRTNVRRSDSQNYVRQADSMTIPKIRKGSLVINDIRAEDAVADHLLRDSSSEDELEDIYDPLVLDGDVFTKKKEATKLEDIKIETKTTDVKPQEFLRSEQYSDSNMCFSLLKFPDSFAGRGGSEDKNETNLDFKLSDIGEGKIGKIIIRKSGKMQLQIGQKFYDLVATKNADFSQDIVARADNDDRKKLGKIGTISAQYIVTPDWEQFF